METEILKNVLDSLDSLCVVYDLNGNIVYPVGDFKRIMLVDNILKSEDRTQAGKTANPEGLYLRNVFY